MIHDESSSSFENSSSFLLRRIKMSVCSVWLVETIEKKKWLSEVRYRTVLCFITKMELIVTVMMEMTVPKSRLWLFNKQDFH